MFTKFSSQQTPGNHVLYWIESYKEYISRFVYLREAVMKTDTYNNIFLREWSRHVMTEFIAPPAIHMCIIMLQILYSIWAAVRYGSHLHYTVALRPVDKL